MNNEATYFLKFEGSKFNIRINKKKRESWVQFALWFIILWTLAERYIIQLGAPNSIIYLIDIVNLLLFVAMVRRNRWKNFSIFILLYFVLTICGIFAALPNYSIWGGNPVFTLIEIRNIIRFPIFFLACLTFLNQSNIERIFKILTIFFYANFVMIIYQYITFHPAGIWTRGDYLNGFFGTSTGGNTYVNVLMLCVVVYWLCRWRNKECKTWEFFLPLGMSITVAALIELKSYFVEVAILYLWYLISQKKTIKEVARNLFIIVSILIVAQFALQFMYKEYPWFRETMTLSGLLELARDSSGYTGTNDLNRLTAVFTIATNIFKGDFANIFAGIGLGNGAIYSLGGSYTKFCQMYEPTHYAWFSTAYVFIQCGIIGLATYICSFLYLFFKKKNKRYALLSQTMVLLAFVLMMYNETLKTDAGYFVYFAISSGFVLCKKELGCGSLLESKISYSERNT